MQAVVEMLKCLSEYGIDVSKSVFVDICWRRWDAIATHLTPPVSRAVTNDLEGGVDTSLDASREDFPQKFGAIVDDIIISSSPLPLLFEREIIRYALRLAQKYTIAKLP